jgi:hypothetical protein
VASGLAAVIWVQLSQCFGLVGIGIAILIHSREQREATDRLTLAVDNLCSELEGKPGPLT